MAALRALGATRFDVVHRCTSGDVTGDRKSVVGYLSAVAVH
jgi:AmmeMemoRadiSam system protein B